MRPKVLVVDGEQQVLTEVSALLSASGYLVECASSLQEASALLHKARYALVIAAVRLSHTGDEGLRVMDEVRERWPGTRTILLSELLSPDLEAEARRRGVDRLLERPFSTAELAQVAGQLVSGSQPAVDIPHRPV